MVPRRVNGVFKRGYVLEERGRVGGGLSIGGKWVLTDLLE